MQVDAALVKRGDDANIDCEAVSLTTEVSPKRRKLIYKTVRPFFIYALFFPLPFVADAGCLPLRLSQTIMYASLVKSVSPRSFSTYKS